MQGTIRIKYKQWVNTYKPLLKTYELDEIDAKVMNFFNHQRVLWTKISETEIWSGYHSDRAVMYCLTVSPYEEGVHIIVEIDK